MIFPFVKKEIWAKIHKVEPEEFDCPKCNKKFPVDIPCAFKNMRGFISQDHGCGRKYNKGVFVEAKGSTALKKAYQMLKEFL